MTTSTSKSTLFIAALCAAPFLGIVLLFEIIPIIAVGINSLFKEGIFSFENYLDLAGSTFQRKAFLTSVELSGATAAIGVIFALPLANVLRNTNRGLQEGVLTYSNIAANFTGFPLALAFVILFGLNGSFTLLLIQAGVVDDLNIYSLGGLAMAYCYFQIPLGILLIFPSLQAITIDIEEAALLVGASRFAFWRRIGLPILAPSLISAFILLFSNAMGGYVMAFALVGGNANLVTVHIGELVIGDVFSDPNMADALAMVLVLTLVVPLICEQLILRRR